MAVTSLLVHAILGVRAWPNFFPRADGFPGSHGPDNYLPCSTMVKKWRTDAISVENWHRHS